MKLLAKLREEIEAGRWNDSAYDENNDKQVDAALATYEKVE